MRNRTRISIAAGLLAALWLAGLASSARAAVPVVSKMQESGPRPEVGLIAKFDPATAPKIEVAGRLLIDLHAEIMLAADKDQVVNNWFNAGFLWGDFGDFGFAGPRKGYPTVGAVDGAKAVTFGGGQLLRGSPLVEDAVVEKDSKGAIRGNLLSPAGMTGPGEYTVEVWAFNPSIQRNECLLGWGDSTVPYPDAKAAPANQWHHLVVVHSGSENKLYVDGALQSSNPGGGTKRGGFVIGAAGDGKDAFSGSIAALRVHEKALAEAQIQKNFQGGIRLGTTFVPNIDPASGADDPTWGPSDNPKYKQLFSKHFRMMWDPVKDVNQVMTDSTARRMLEDYEEVYDLYEQMGMAAPVVSANKKDRGDGVKYKINICINWGGGAFGGFNGARGCGYPIHAPGVVHAHELGHAYQTQQLGGLAGNWWETHTSWLSKMFENRKSKFNYNNAMIANAMFFVSNGRNYYHCYHIFEQLGLDPELGPMFIAKLWNTNGWDAYPFARAEELFPGKVSYFKDQWVKMARRNITWDYPDAIKNPKDVDLRNARTLLEPIPYEPGVFRCPKDMAPQQFGYVICPLAPQAKTVTVDLGGYINPERGSEWRACLVAVNAKNESRYGEIFAKGKNSMTLQPDEKELYLVVAATPKTMMIEMAGEGRTADYRSFEQSQFPFTVRMEGCAPKDIWAAGKPSVPGKAHANGGGFVADTARVDATAFVGPDAQVLDQAQVRGNARVEDYAVVKGNAEVRDQARVSGHALVQGSAVVRDYAKVRDFGNTASKVADFAKVAEHGANNGTATEYATVKGCASSGGKNYGTGIVDGMYAKGNEVSKGMWLTWSWATGKNAGELDQDLGGVYMQLLFDKPHPYLALDTYGVTYGYLVNGAQTVKDANTTASLLALNGKDQFVELQKDVADMHDLTLVIRADWAGGKGQALFSAGADAKNCMYLVPSDSDGVLAFAIVKDGQVQAVKGKSAFPVGKMAEVRVILSEDTATLYLDGAEVGRNDKMTFNPEDVKSTACYLGRGLDGGFFAGRIDAVTVYSIPLVKTAPPTPNPAAWRFEPTAFSDSGVTMYAQPGCDTKPGIQYLFTETTGKGHSSGWQDSPEYEDKGLKAGETCKYTVKMRDAAGHETQPSAEKEARWAGSAAYAADQAPNGAPMFVIEAEHYQDKVKGKFHEWIPQNLLDNYRGEGAMYSAPEDGPAVGDYLADAPRLDYRIRVEKPGKYYLWTRGYGRWWLSNSIQVGLDGRQQQVAYPGWQNLTYRWKRHVSQDNDNPIKPFTIDAPGIHTFSVWMNEDGCSVDAFILTTADYDEFKPTDEVDINKDLVGKGRMPESRVMLDGKPVQVMKPVAQPEWSSLKPVVLDGSRAAMQARNYKDMLGAAEYYFEETSGTGKNSGWQKAPYCEFKGLDAGKEYAFRYKLRTPAPESKETPWSETVAAKWDASKAFVEPADGVTVIEAEHFSNNAPAPDGHRWVLSKGSPEAPASGEGCMVSDIKNAMPFLGKTTDLKARLDYQVDFTKAGRHFVWVLGYGTYRFNHMLNVGLDMDGGDWGKVDMGWEGLTWKRSSAFEVPAPGIRTLNVWLNHDALVIDKIIVATDEEYRPTKQAESSDGAPTGPGPAETRQGR